MLKSCKYEVSVGNHLGAKYKLLITDSMKLSGYIYHKMTHISSVDPNSFNYITYILIYTINELLELRFRYITLSPFSFVLPISVTMHFHKYMFRP